MKNENDTRKVLVIQTTNETYSYSFGSRLAEYLYARITNEMEHGYQPDEIVIDEYTKLWINKDHIVSLRLESEGGEE